jgi:hypothetical protein
MTKKKRNAADAEGFAEDAEGMDFLGVRCASSAASAFSDNSSRRPALLLTSQLVR